MSYIQTPGPAHRLAESWLADPAFTAWLATMRPGHAPKQALLCLCDAESLESLDFAAAHRFHHHVRVPFMAHLGVQ